MRTAIWLAITGVSLYLVAPSASTCSARGDDVGRIAPVWLLAMVALQALSLVCLWALQRLALPRPRWTPVITSQLAGNALAKVAPGGGALGAALQFRMLVQAGLGRARPWSG